MVFVFRFDVFFDVGLGVFVVVDIIVLIDVFVGFDVEVVCDVVR